MTIRAVVFDLDGTLVDSRADIVGAVRFILGRYGAKVPSDAQIASYVGDGARSLLSRAFRIPLEDPALDEIFATFLEYYDVHAADHTALYPGAEDVLTALAPLPLALCTNKPRGPTELVLRVLGLTDRFDVVVAGGDLKAHKPDPAPMFHIASALGLSAADLVMVGDGVQDVRSGKSSGARTIAVLGGFGSEADLRAAGPDRVVGGIQEVVPAVREFSR